MKRYYAENGGSMGPVYREDEFGDYVLYSDVAPLVEAAYREGFRDGMVDSVADESGIGGVGEDAYWSGSKTRAALTTIDAQERGV